LSFILGEFIFGVAKPEYNLDATLKLAASDLGLKTSGFGNPGATFFSCMSYLFSITLTFLK